LLQSTRAHGSVPDGSVRRAHVLESSYLILWKYLSQLIVIPDYIVIQLFKKGEYLLVVVPVFLMRLKFLRRTNFVQHGFKPIGDANPNSSGNRLPQGRHIRLPGNSHIGAQYIGKDLGPHIYFCTTPGHVYPPCIDFFHFHNF